MIKTRITFKDGTAIISEYHGEVLNFRDWANDFAKNRWVCYGNTLFNTDDVRYIEEVTE